MKFPNQVFVRARQVHGNRIVEVQSEHDDYVYEADGLITKNRDLALCSITADCMPIMISSVSDEWFVALHAGWRGVATRIVPKAIELLKEKRVDTKSLTVWIGPHITLPSFEVQSDVLELIVGSVKDKNSVEIRPSNEGRSYVSLFHVVMAQLDEYDILKSQFTFTNIDTKTSARFCSARREGQQAGRQISFIRRID